MKTLSAVLLSLLVSPLAASTLGFEAGSADALRLFQNGAPVFRFQARSPWSELIEKIRVLGTYREADGMIPAGYGIQDIRGAKDAAHVADYANVWGYTDDGGRFIPGFVTFVSEDWAIDAAGNWSITQWLFTLNLDGSIQRASWNWLSEDRDGRVLDSRSQAKQPGDADAKAKLDALLAGWRAFKR